MAPQSSNGLGTVGLHHICHGHATQQTAALGEEQGRFAVLGQPVSVGLHGRQRDTVLRQMTGIAGQHRFAGEGGLDPAAGDGAEAGHGAEGDVAGLRLLHDGVGQRVLRGLFRRGGHAEELLLRDAGGTEDIRDTGLAHGDGAGLIQHHRLHLVQQLQTFGGLDEDALLGGLVPCPP